MPLIKTHFRKTFLLSLFFIFVVFQVSFTNTLAANANYSVTPKSGYVQVNKDFVFDILIDTDNENSNLARAVLTFDPKMIRVVKAEKNSNLYCNWPEDEQTIDNVNGVIMITAFCQSGAGTLYKTTGEPEVFSRLTFRPLKAGRVTFNWKWTGENQSFNSAIMKDGSPPQNLLTTVPAAFSFNAVALTGGNNGNNGGTTPVTGLFDGELIIVGLVTLISSILIFGGTYLIFFANKRNINKRFKTLVIYKDDE